MHSPPLFGALSLLMHGPPLFLDSDSDTDPITYHTRRVRLQRPLLCILNWTRIRFPDESIIYFMRKVTALMHRFLCHTTPLNQITDNGPFEEPLISLVWTSVTSPLDFQLRSRQLLKAAYVLTFRWPSSFAVSLRVDTLLLVCRIFFLCLVRSSSRSGSRNWVGWWRETWNLYGHLQYLSRGWHGPPSCLVDSLRSSLWICTFRLVRVYELRVHSHLRFIRRELLREFITA